MSATAASARILLIEDDPALGAVTAEVLMQLGHEVTWSVSANAGFESLRQEQDFDAVLLDLGLGDNDGVTLIKTLRMRGNSLPPLIVFSAQPITTIQLAAETIGAVAILQKPCTAKDLTGALQRALQPAAAES